MVDESLPNDIDLKAFVEAAGQSFSEAQKALVPGLDVPINMMLNSAELELKVAVSSDVKGRMSICPISSQELRRGGIDPAMLSTIRISFISTIGETKQPAAPSTTPPTAPKRTLSEIIKEIHSRGWRC